MLLGFQENGGGKGGKGGNKNGSANYEAMAVDKTNNGILKTDSERLARLTQEKQEEARRMQWIFEVQPGTRLVQVLDKA